MAVAVVTQRLKKEKSHMPKVQVLIYPWLQMINTLLPSRHVFHSVNIHGRIMDQSSIVPYYALGMTEVSSEVEDVIRTNSHVALITDPIVRKKIKSYFDVTKLPDFFTKNRPYLNEYDKLVKRMYPESLPENHILKKDKKMASILGKLHEPTYSPLLADDEDLTDLPKAYFQIIETDIYRDEGLLYANRLLKSKSEVFISLYDKAFHPCANLINAKTGFKVSVKMMNELVEYLKENL
jgi:acetyl esterase/lipase